MSRKKGKSRSKRASTHHALANTDFDVKRDAMRAGRRGYGIGMGPKAATTIGNFYDQID